MESEKRFQVFLSSTYQDLREERSTVIQTLLGLEAFPAGMELFPAADDDAWTVIESVIEECDYYVLIIAGKYGSIDPSSGLSFTEREYDAAVRLKKPIMAFLHDNIGNLAADKVELDESMRAKVEVFRGKVKRAKHVKFWSNADQLAGRIATSWPLFKRNYPAIGWMRADQASNREQLEALAKSDARIRALEAELERTRTQAPPGTETLAQGGERFELQLLVRGEWSGDGLRALRSTTWFTIRPSWDLTFGFLGPSMMQEAAAADLQSKFEPLAVTYFYDQAEKAFVDEITARARDADSDPDSLSYSIKEIAIADEEFGAVILQFHALGLIQQPVKQRSVKDTAIYWTLTPFGRTKLTQLRALQKGESKLDRLHPGDAEESKFES